MGKTDGIPHFFVACGMLRDEAGYSPRCYKYAIESILVHDVLAYNLVCVVYVSLYGFV